ncbi:hypothetical protein Sme01_30770 [Sphaerisporangium melleum]|uniref:Uncharacterized protein n=1 Tax=Sphaerisporangium melleum TaxID=321316 RepID=A0A917R918_9ACTN|nr:hypothetical protein GCM10007964_42200 [Sphaerisporangium melleum]GII70601.1 hypothetical protein Sme01_30770 [Sphaerisporangium melleum]
MAGMREPLERLPDLRLDRIHDRPLARPPESSGRQVGLAGGSPGGTAADFPLITLQTSLKGVHTHPSPVSAPVAAADTGH